MENARDGSSPAKIAGNIGFAGLTLSVCSPLLAGFFLALVGRIFRNLEQSFSCPAQNPLGLFSLR
jgi:hypothetical protein